MYGFHHYRFIGFTLWLCVNAVNVWGEIVTEVVTPAWRPSGVALSVSSTASPLTKIAAAAWVPAGFEHLLEPQTTMVDVYYGGRYLQSQLATFSPGEIHFKQPVKIANNIPNLLDRSRIQTWLSESLSSNESLLCHSRGQSNCGILTPEVIGVIFNPQSYRVDVFVAASELSVEKVEITKFLPSSDTEFSFIQGLSVAYSKPEALQDNYSINGSTSLAYKESRLRLLSNYSKDDGFVIDVLAWEKDFEGLSYQLGLLQTNNQGAGFLPELEVMGGRFASTLDTRNDLDFSEGVLLNVFLPTRSRVEIYKDERLLYSAVYDAGNQNLDTSLLPTGAYNVTIRIIEQGGRSYDQVRFYQKTSRIPPADQDIYFVEFGRLMSNEHSQRLPEALDNYLARGGYSKRVSAGFGVNAGLAVVESDAMVETGWYYFGNNWDFSGSLARGKDNSWGQFYSSGWRFNDIYLSGRYRQIQVNSRSLLDLSDIRLLGDENMTESSMRVSVPLGNGRAAFETRSNSRGGERITANTLSYSLPPFNTNSLARLQANAEVTEVEGAWQALLTLTFDISDDHWRYRVAQQRSGTRVENDQHHINRTSLGLSWEDRDLFYSDVYAGMNVATQRGDSQAEIQGSIRSQQGELKLSANHINQNGQTGTGYAMFGTTSIVSDFHGVVMGGREINQSAIIVDLNEIEGAELEFGIMVDDSVKAYAVSGAASVVNLRPFETYTVGLKDGGQALLEFDQRPQELTLYPGNVKRLSWQVDKIDVVFGRLVDANGKAIVNAVIEGVAGLAMTDDVGIFQADLIQGTRNLTVKNRTLSCTVELPSYRSVREVARLGTLVCR